jgi:iron(II)-dependent oxidoreductase
MFTAPPSAAELARLLNDARRRTLELIVDLDDRQMIGPQLAIVNPPLWEIGHIAWFQEFWTLRHLRGQRPMLEGADALYNSADVAHDTRWELRLPSREATLAHMNAVLARVIDSLGVEPTPEEIYFHILVLFHEDMHGEALAYTRQTLCYSPPKLSTVKEVTIDGSAAAGDVEVPGGTFMLGAPPDSVFVFDNEKWEHPVEVKPFRIARTAVTNAEFAAFVDDGGYRRRELWTEDGWRWLQNGGSPALAKSFAKFFHREQNTARETGRETIEHPVYWEKQSGGKWMQRVFDQWLPLQEHLPVLHVNWYEASAYAKWARRRLPTEAEWELAGASEPESAGCGILPRKRFFPWGEEAPSPERANLDLHSSGPLPVGALAAGDSAFGCRQMIGNVWEWTASDFLPYPEFTADPYKEYSAPWFGTHKVLRGGCWVTRSRLIRNTWRNFYTPDRRDVWAGFRTCAE